jgi:fibronectin-binding autotransporter adhesin
MDDYLKGVMVMFGYDSDRSAAKLLARSVVAGASILAAVFAGTAVPAAAGTYNWNGGGGTSSIIDGPGTWSAGTGTWYDGVSNYSALWSNGNGAVFGGGSSGAAGTVSVSGSVSATNLTFSQPASGNYAFSGGTISLSGNTLTDNATGITTINSNLTIGLSTTQAFSVASGGTLAITGPIGSAAQNGSTSTNAFYGMYGPGVLEFQNDSGTLYNGNIGMYGGSIVFNGANITIPENTFRWYNSAVNSTAQIVLENGSDVQIGSAAGAQSNSFMGQTAVSGGTAAMILTITSGTLSYGPGIYGLRLGGSSGDVASVNQSGGLFDMLATALNGESPNLTGICLGYASGGNGTYNLSGGTVVAPAVGLTSGTGVFNFNGGTLMPDVNNNSGANGSTTTCFMNGLTAANVQAGGAYINTNVYSITISQALLHSGTNAIDGGLTVSGSGNLTLTGGNTFNGNLLVSSGTLTDGIAENSASVTAGGLGNMTTSGRQIQVNSGGTLLFSVSNPLGSLAALQNASIVINGGTISHGTVFVTLPNITLENGAVLTGGNGVSATTQTFNLMGSVTVAGTSGSTMKTVGTTNTGIHLGSGNVAFNVGSTGPGPDLTVAVPLVDQSGGSGSSLTKTGLGIMLLTAANTYTGTTYVNGGTMQIGDGTSGHDATLTTSAIANNASLVYDVFGTQTPSCVVSGSGGQIKTGAGTLILTLPNTYMGTTTLGAGTLNLGGGENPGVSGPLGANTAPGAIILNGGYLQYSYANQYDYSGRFSTAANQAYNVDTNGQSVTWATALTSSGGSLNEVGAGVLTLSASNTYSGGTTVTAGTLALLPGGTLGSGNVNINSGSVLDVSAVPGGYTLSGSTLTAGEASSPATDINGTLLANRATLVPLAAGSAGTMTISGSLAMNNAAVAYVPGDVISVGAGLSLSGTDSIVVNSVLSNGTYSLFSFPAGTFAPSSTAHLALVGGIGGRSSASFVDTGTALNFVVSGYFANLTWTATTGATAGVWDTQNNKNWYNPQIAGPDQFYALDNVTFDDTAGTANGTVRINGAVSPGSITVNNTNVAYTLTGTGSIAGLGGLTMNGPGSLTMSTSNTFSGGTTLNNGLLNANAAQALGTGTLSVNGGTLNVNAAQAISSGTLNGGLLDANANAALGSGPLTINGGTLGNTSGSVTLSNNAQYWNADFVFSGPGNLNLGTGPVTLSTSRTVTVTGGNLTVGGTVSGTGASLTLAGAGGLILAGPNTYNSGTLILGGTLTAANNSALGAGPVTLNPSSGNAVLALTSPAPSIGLLANGGGGASSIVLGNPAAPSATALTLGTNNGDVSFSGIISDQSLANPAAAGSLIKTGSGTLTLSGSNTYAGGTTFSTGILAVGGPSALGSGTLNMGGGTLAAAGGPQTINNAILSSTAGTQGFDTTAGNLTLTGPFTASGFVGTSMFYTKFGPGNLTFLNDNVTLAGGMAVADGTITFNGANVSAPDDTLRWTNTSGTAAIVLTGNANLQVSSGAGPGTNARMGQLAPLSGTTTQILAISSGTLNFANVNLYTLVVGDEPGTNGIVNQSGGVLSFAAGGAGEGIDLAALASSTGIYNLNGGVLRTPSVFQGSGVGTFNFNGGTLQANANSTSFLTGLSATYIQAGGAFINDGGFAITIGQALLSGASPDGGLTKIGQGTLTLNGANTYNGPTSISSGTLALGANGSIAQSAAISVASGATFNVSALGANYHLLSGQTLTGTGSITVSGAVTANSGSIILSPGPGLFRTLNVGSLTLSTGSVLNYDVGNGTQDVINVTSNNGLTVNGGGINLYQGDGMTPFSTPGTYTLLNYAGALSGAAVNLSVLDPNPAELYSFVDTGSAVELNIAAPNTWNGAGSPNVNWSDSANWSSLQVPGSGSALLFSGTQGLANSNNIANLSLSRLTFSSSAGAFNLSGNSIQLNGPITNSSTATQTIGLNIGLLENVTVNAAAGSILMNGVISDGGGYGISATGSGAVVLAAANTYSGATNISAGVLSLAHSQAVQFSTVNMGGGGLSFAAGVTSPMLGGLSGSGNIALATAASEPVALNVGGNGQSTTYSGTLSGPGGLVKQGAGTLTLAASQNYSGATVISGGVLQLSGAAAAQGLAHDWNFTTGSLVDSVGGLTATAVGSTSLNSNGLTINGNGSSHVSYATLGANILPTTDSPCTIELWATENQVESWSRIFDFGSSTTNYLMWCFTQGTANPSAVSVNDINNWAAGTFTPGTEYHIALVLTPNGANTELNWYQMDTSGNLISSSSTTVSNWNLSDLTQTNEWLGNSEFATDQDANATYAAVRIWDASLTQAQLSTLAALGPSAIPGGGGNVLPATTPVVIAPGATLDLNGGTQQIASLRDSSPGLGGSVVNSNASMAALVLAPSGGSTTFSGQIGGTNGAISLVLAGPGTQVLAGANSYIGPTIIAGGALEAVDGVGLPAGSNLVFSGSLAANGYGAVLQSSGSFTRTLGPYSGQVQWTGDGGFSANGGPLTVSMSPGIPLIWNNNSLGNGTPYFLGDGNVLTFGSPTANNQVNFTDSIDLNGEIRQIDVAAGLGGDSALISGDIIDGQNNGNGGLLKTGAGMLILSGENTYDGGTFVNAGTLVVDSPTALPDGSSLTVGLGASSIFAPAASPAGLAAVPEPGTLALVFAALWSAVVCHRFSKRSAGAPGGPGPLP